MNETAKLKSPVDGHQHPMRPQRKCSFQPWPKPHSALGYLTPAAYLATRAASLELRNGSAQLPFRPTIDN